MTEDVLTWWLFLCVVAGVNIAAWTLSFAALERRRLTFTAEMYAARRLQLFLSAGYVFGCAFRSVVLVYDVPRLCMFDSWLCSVMVGRTVATIAELCFVTQLALMLREISTVTHSVTGRIVSATIVPLIVIAETCSWYSVLTTSNMGHVVEESLWGLSAALVVISLLAIRPRVIPALRPLLAAGCIVGAGYVAFMLFVDVPMYWSRWVADESSGRAYMDLFHGVLDASGRWVVSRKWDAWQHEVPWMSLYFSVAVWLSIALIHAPVLKRLRPSRRRKAAAVARTPLRAAR
jgi:hypothetical protein